MIYGYAIAIAIEIQHWWQTLIFLRSVSKLPLLPHHKIIFPPKPLVLNTVLHCTAVRSDLHVPIFSGHTPLQIIGQSPLCVIHRYRYALQSVAQWVWLVWAEAIMIPGGWWGKTRDGKLVAGWKREEEERGWEKKEKMWEKKGGGSAAANACIIIKL